MMNLCRECGKPASPEYADEHDGLCMACAHRHHAPVTLPTVSPHHFLGSRRIFLDDKEITRSDIDHDMVQPQPTDPIRDAIDRAWGDYCRDVGGDS